MIKSQLYEFIALTGIIFSLIFINVTLLYQNAELITKNTNEIVKNTQATNCNKMILFNLHYNITESVPDECK